jgi:hypothetical protein
MIPIFPQNVTSQHSRRLGVELIPAIIAYSEAGIVEVRDGMKQHLHLFEAKETMMNCIVVEKLGQCTSFEMYLESDQSFIVACVMDNNSNGSFIFTTFRDSHLRAFSDITRLLNDHDDYVGKMSRDWLSGLTFALFNRSDEIVSEIRYRMVNCKLSVRRFLTLFFSLLDFCRPSLKGSP